MMHGPLGDRDLIKPATSNPLVAAFERALAFCHGVIVVLAALALIAACVILSYSVLGRALFQAANYWQDEAAVFLLVGATFMTAGYVQAQRGHIGIEAFVGLLPPLANRIRLWLVDVASLLFCAILALQLKNPQGIGLLIAVTVFVLMGLVHDLFFQRAFWFACGLMLLNAGEASARPPGVVSDVLDTRARP